MVEDVVGALASSATRLQIANVAFHHSEMGAPFDSAKDVIDVVAMTRREIVDANDCLAERQQFLEQVRSDEPRDPGNYPSPRS
jgi:hypothetical protein